MNVLLSYFYCICSSFNKLIFLLIQWSECPLLGTLEQLGEEWSGVELDRLAQSQSHAVSLANWKG